MNWTRPCKCCGKTTDAPSGLCTKECFEDYHGEEWRDGSHEDDIEGHYSGCVCADCSDAELTAEND